MTPTGFAQYAENARYSQEDGPRAAKVRTPSGGDTHDAWLRDAAEGLRELAGPREANDVDDPGKPSGTSTGRSEKGGFWRLMLHDAARLIEQAREKRRQAVADRTAKE
jgi:hypothetical protein